MMKRIISVLLIIVLICLMGCSWSKDSYFSILFIDVGQGDAALIECDGHYMLIDGGDTTAGKTIQDVLVSHKPKPITQLDYLVVSHLHKDHYGGLIEGLKNVTKIGRTFSNSYESDKEMFNKFEEELGKVNGKGSRITIPYEGYTFKLGRATVEVVDATSKEENDSLVLLITYGETRFLFTGDILYSGQKRLVEKYAKGGDAKYRIDVLKMPHHGSWGQLHTSDNDLNRLISTFMPCYAIISVGIGNKYGHPHQETLDLLNQAEVRMFRTDKNGNITVKSDGHTVTVEPSR